MPQLTKTKIREIVSEQLETGTDALVEDEIAELANAIAEKLCAADDDIEDDDSDGDADERNEETYSDE